LQSKSDNNYQINFDALEFSGDDISSYHVPICDDNCDGYRRDQCIASSIKDVEGRHDRNLLLSAGNFTKNLDSAQKIYPAICKSKCAGQVDDNCMGVAGCQAYRRDLLKVGTIAPSFPYDDDEEEEEGNSTIAPAGKFGGTYPPYCRDRCKYFPVDQCREPGCVGYRRVLTDLVDDEEDRDLQIKKGNFSGFAGMDFGTYPPSCKSKCAGQTDNRCMGVPGCQGYRRALHEEAHLSPADWCVKASQVIDQQLNNALRHVSPQCRALLQAPRRKECYDTAAICGAK
jgi:hypothetical protein